MRILLFGIQGSGKGTIGKYLAEKHHVPFVAMGDLLRELGGQETEQGRLIKSFLDQGHFIDDDLAMKILNKRLDQADARDGFVLDGAPRNLYQEKLFSHELDLVVLIKLDEKEAIRRLISRGRHDDTDQAIRKRIAWHKENTEPLIEFFRQKRVRIVEIDNSPSEEEVRKSLDELLKN